LASVLVFAVTAERDTTSGPGAIACCRSGWIACTAAKPVRALGATWLGAVGAAGALGAAERCAVVGAAWLVGAINARIDWFGCGGAATAATGAVAT
jgi:hypothetical protein